MWNEVAQMPLKKLFLVIVLLSVSFPGCSNDTLYTKDAFLMDTVVHFKVKGALSEGLKARAVNNAAARMKELAKRFDYYSGESELAKLNNQKSAENSPSSPEMQQVLVEAERLRKLTKGAFDVKFDRGGKIDLGGIAKGFIVDEGIRILKKQGIKEAIINAGGDMYCMGKYKIGIRDPKDRQRVITVLLVRDKGVATSAAYERGAHITDPRKGEAVIKPGKSVTVAAESCMRADALATALYVMEPREGLSIIEGIDGAECFIIDETGETHASSGLRFREIS